MNSVCRLITLGVHILVKVKIVSEYLLRHYFTSNVVEETFTKLFAKKLTTFSLTPFPLRKIIVILHLRVQYLTEGYTVPLRPTYFICFLSVLPSRLPRQFPADCKARYPGNQRSQIICRLL